MINSLKALQTRLSPPLLALLLAIILYFIGGILAPGFVNVEQAINIVRLAAFLGIIAAGQTLIIISGSEGIDLSAGAVVTLGAILAFRISNGQDSMVIPGLLVALAAGASIGFSNGLGITLFGIPPLVMTLGMTGVVNGLGITLFGIPPLVMTLGMTGVVAGTIRAVTRGELEGGTPPIMGKLISAPLVAGLPGVIFLWLLIGFGMWLLLERTAYGKQLFAIGINRTTARLSGARVQLAFWCACATGGLGDLYTWGSIGGIGWVYLVGFLTNRVFEFGAALFIPVYCGSCGRRDGLGRRSGQLLGYDVRRIGADTATKPTPRPANRRGAPIDCARLDTGCADFILRA